MNEHPFLDDELRDQAAQYVLGSLSESEMRSLQSHLAHCGACRAEVEALLELSHDLCLLYPARAPAPDLWQRVVGRISETGTGDATAVSAEVQIWRRWDRAPAAGNAAFTFVPGASGDWQSTAIQGIEARRLYVDADNDRATFLVRMAPGTAYPAHVHAGPEECYVLSGDLEVGDVRMHAGDYQRAEAASRHGVQSTKEGCLLLLVSSLEDEIVA